jgi:hypothetical protein
MVAEDLARTRSIPLDGVFGKDPVLIDALDPLEAGAPKEVSLPSVSRRR